MSGPYIGLIDCNNFFVSCERLFRPELANQPVLVLSSNDGCVVARSQEVKDMGIPMGIPYFQIKDIIKDKGITTFSSHFALYRDISSRVFSVVKHELDRVEQYSIDEAFFTLYGDVVTEAKALREKILKEVGIPVSVGLAATKTQAKYANLLAKKGSGVCLIEPAEWLSLVPDIPVSKIWGVGQKLELKLKNNEISTVHDLLQSDPSRIRALFGVVGLRLQRELGGESVYRLANKAAPQQSILSSRSFQNPTNDLSVLADAVAYHARHTAKDLRAMQMEAGSIRVSIRPSRYSDFGLQGGSKEAILPATTNSTLTLLKVANYLLNELYRADVPYKKVGVTLNFLRFSGHGQGSLFTESVETDSGLMQVIDSLNCKADKELIKIGSRLRTKEWQARLDSRSPAYTTNWKDIALVKA